MISGNILTVLTLDPALEAQIGDSVVQANDGSYVNLDPGTVHALLEALKVEHERVSRIGIAPAVLCSAKVRRHLKQISEQVLPRLAVFSYNEIQPDIEIRTVGSISTTGSGVTEVLSA